MNVKHFAFIVAVSLNGLMPQAIATEKPPIAVSASETDLLAIAKAIREELRIIDACVDQWAIEKNLPKGEYPMIKDIIVYLKPGTRLHSELSAGRCTDSLGNPISIPAAETAPRVPRATFDHLSSVAPESFWLSAGFKIEPLPASK